MVDIFNEVSMMYKDLMMLSDQVMVLERTLEENTKSLSKYVRAYYLAFGNTRKHKETQGNTRKHKETQGNTRKHKETQGNIL